MRLFDKLVSSERFAMNWRVLLLQGAVIGFMGVVLGTASIFSPNATILNARDFSWLPMSGMVILALGILECIDAYFAKEMRDFYQNLQVGALDTVVGGLVILGVSGPPQRLAMLIAAYLIVRGTVRITLVRALRLPNAFSTSVGGLASMLLGTMIFMEWPSDAAWFLAFSLNVEIACRGWAILMFGLWVKRSARQA